MTRSFRIGAAIATGLLGCALVAPAASGSAEQKSAPSRHVLILSVDGLHQSDLLWYVAHHPKSALASLVNRGVDYTHARTPVPSDSFPGLIGQFTGGNPDSTGIYYDDTYNAALLPAGTTACAGKKRGAEVDLTEDLDLNKASVDAGQGLSGLPANILKMTANPRSLINPAALPVDPATCKPVYPHQYLKVNTVFEVARQAGLRTAWSDKHPAYEILNGPSGAGVQDLFTPEINSQAAGLPAGADWTSNNTKTRQYDGYKVQAVLNQIGGYDHSRTVQVGTPGVFGMNFQAVSTAQKLPSSDGQQGGYLPGGTTPGLVLAGALDFVDQSVGTMLTGLAEHHLTGSTTVILSAKHGQSPTDPTTLTRIDDGKLLDGLNAAWKTAHPGAGDLVAHSVDDDAMLLWLTDRSTAATAFARTYLLAQSGTGTNSAGASKAFVHSGLSTVYAGRAAAAFYRVRPGDPRVPDVFGVVQHGVVYTGGKGKIAEHGGTDPQDRDVPLIVAGPHQRHSVVSAVVSTIQIAPTTLRLLGLDPAALQAVRQDHTQTLPRS